MSRPRTADEHDPGAKAGGPHYFVCDQKVTGNTAAAGGYAILFAATDDQ